MLNIVHEDSVLLNQFSIFKILQFEQGVSNRILRHGRIEPTQRIVQFDLIKRTAEIPLHIGTVNITVSHVLKQFYDGVLIVRFRIKS